jgi:hypothetical protein
MNPMMQQQMPQQGGGMVQQAMQKTPSEQSAPAQVKQQQAAGKPDAGKLQRNYNKLVLAGMKALFSKETQQNLMDDLARQDAPLPQIVAESITGLMQMLDGMGEKPIPANILAPASLALMMQVFDFLKQSGDEFTEQDIVAASEMVVRMVAESIIKPRLAGGGQSAPQQGAVAPEAAPQGPAGAMPPQAQAMQAGAPAGGMVGMAQQQGGV